MGSPSPLMSVLRVTISKFECLEIFVDNVNPSLPLASSAAVSTYFSFRDASDGRNILPTLTLDRVVFILLLLEFGTV